jgi:hypothetical protein
MSVRVPTFLAGFVLALFAATVFAGVGVWTTNGPIGQQGKVVADAGLGTLYSGTTTGMAVSQDNGQTWTATGSGAPPLFVLAARSGIVYAYSVDFSNNPLIRSVLWKSADAGATWTQLSSGVYASYQITSDPSSASTVYRSTATGTIRMPISGGFDRSTDGGQNWTSIDNGIAGNVVTAFVIDPRNPTVLYLANAPEGMQGVPPPPSGFFKSIDSGMTWTPLTSSLGTVLGLAIDPAASTLYASSSTGVYRSSDQGATFSQVSSTVVAFNLLLDTVHPNRLYASLSGFQGVVASVDGGVTWTSLNNGLSGSSLGVTSLAIDSTGRFLHATTAQSGVFDYESSNCSADAHTLCLNNGRFAVTADFQTTPEGPSAPATAVPLTPDTGYFWFFDPNNVEVVTKVLNGCSTNGQYWFFASGLTNVRVQVDVTDTLTGTSNPYSNTFGTPFQPIQDTSAFPCP